MTKQHDPRTFKASTVEEAVSIIVKSLKADDLQHIKEMPKEKLIVLHHSLGTWIRNSFGLWASNDVLLRATGEHHPDDASFKIIIAVWEKLNEV